MKIGVAVHASSRGACEDTPPTGMECSQIVALAASYGGDCSTDLAAAGLPGQTASDLCCAACNPAAATTAAPVSAGTWR